MIFVLLLGLDCRTGIDIRIVNDTNPNKFQKYAAKYRVLVLVVQPLLRYDKDTLHAVNI
jgi:hypothetical protein